MISPSTGDMVFRGFFSVGAGAVVSVGAVVGLVWGWVAMTATSSVPMVPTSTSSVSWMEICSVWLAFW